MPRLTTYLGHADPKSTYWYLTGTPELLALAAARLERIRRRRRVTDCIVNDLAPLLQGFFTDKLIRQRQASPHTIAAYRDTFILLLGFTAQHTGRQPAQLEHRRPRRSHSSARS